MDRTRKARHAAARLPARMAELINDVEGRNRPSGTVVHLHRGREFSCALTPSTLNAVGSSFWPIHFWSSRCSECFESPSATRNFPQPGAPPTSSGEQAVVPSVYGAVVSGASLLTILSTLTLWRQSPPPVVEVDKCRVIQKYYERTVESLDALATRKLRDCAQHRMLD